MTPRLSPSGRIKAVCPDCGTPTQFKRHGPEIVKKYGKMERGRFAQSWVLRSYLYTCTACNRAGYAEVKEAGTPQERRISLEAFFPPSITHRTLPPLTPPEIVAEYGEAERSVAFKCSRAGAALVRSALEKTLIANGYKSSDMGLKRRLTLAGNEGIVTKAHVELAEEHVRILGNDVLHGKWREVAAEEVEKALEYVMWILRDFYEARETIEGILRKKERLPEAKDPAKEAADTD